MKLAERARDQKPAPFNPKSETPPLNPKPGTIGFWSLKPETRNNQVLEQWSSLGALETSVAIDLSEFNVFDIKVGYSDGVGHNRSRRA